MLSALILGITVAAGLFNVSAGLDLTPTPVEYTNEGIVFKQLVFNDGDRRISYEPPHNWTYRSSSPDHLSLTPPGDIRADAEIQVIPLAAPASLDQGSIDALRLQFLGRLPPDAQNVTMVREIPQPIPLHGSQTYEFSVSYQTLGETFVRTTIFALFADKELIFRFTSRKADHDRLSAIFRGSILSWQTVQSGTAGDPPGREAATTGSVQRQ